MRGACRCRMRAACIARPRPASRASRCHRLTPVDPRRRASPDGDGDVYFGGHGVDHLATRPSSSHGPRLVQYNCFFGSPPPFPAFLAPCRLCPCRLATFERWEVSFGQHKEHAVHVQNILMEEDQRTQMRRHKAWIGKHCALFRARLCACASHVDMCGQTTYFDLLKRMPRDPSQDHHFGSPDFDLLLSVVSTEAALAAQGVGGGGLQCTPKH